MSRWSNVSAWSDGLIADWLGWQLPPAQAVVDESGWSVEKVGDCCARCGASVGGGEQDQRGCGSCRNRRLPYQSMVRLGPYLPPLSSWIAAVKYRQWAEMAGLLGERLGGAIIDRHGVDPQRTVMVPMPMPWQRRLYRGIDHAAIIAQAAAERCDAGMIRMLAKRNGSPQVGLTLDQRRRNLRGRLRLRRRWGGWPVHELDIVLVDDVTTSGASLRTAARLLRTLRPRRIIAAALAVADERSRRMLQTIDGLRAEAGHDDSQPSERPLIETVIKGSSAPDAGALAAVAGTAAPSTQSMPAATADSRS
jgi:predicted amidophosphoribosyltransferase